jgi:creatinine amidohydrolase
MDKAAKNIKTPLFRVYFKNRGKELFEDAMTGDAILASKEKGAHKGIVNI